MLLSKRLMAPAVAGGAFTPADLFTGTEEGGWYNIQDPTTMNTLSDQTGSTPGLGDPVGYIEDQSGNGNHLTQATTGNRPTLGNTADPATTGMWFLYFDGVSDHYITSVGFFGGSATTLTIAGGFEDEQISTSSDDQERPLSLGSGTVGTATANKEVFAQALDTSLRFDGATTGTGSEAISKNTPYIRLSTRNGNAVVDRIDGVENINTTVTLNPTIDELAVMAPVSATYPEGKVFSIFAIDKVLSSTEIDDLETYLADVTGVTL